jgi:putative ABC transport system permease protein
VKTVKLALKSLASSPTKSVLTLITVGLGVAVLILAISVSTYLSQILSRELEHEGIIVNISNAEYDSEGELERVMPPQIDENVMDVLRSEVDGIYAIAPISGAFWNEVKVGERTYRLRNVVGTTEEYARVMGFELAAGDFFTKEDVEKGSKVVIISESLAKLLFGSSNDALGGIIQPPARGSFSHEGGRRIATVQNFAVVGVFIDPGELKRKSYSVADLVIPFTSMLPAGANIQMIQRFMLSTTVMKVRGMEIVAVESQVREILSREYGEDLKLAVWEGTPRGESGIIEEARRTVSTFTLVVNILGFVLLITGSIGILSIMLVEILGRTREISLERAMGASRSNIIREYFTRAAILSLVSAVFGIILSLIFARPLTHLLLPLFETMGVTEAAGGVLNPFAVLIGTAVALIIGGIFGVFPVFTTLKIGIAEGIREV